MNFKPTIIATDKEHLQDIILQEILDHGYNCDLNHIDVSGITDMSSLLNARRDFRGQNINLLKFNGFIDQWNVANVVNMERMFHKTQFNGDISNWDVSRVTNMRLLFADSPFNGDISAWNTSRVEDMCSTFAVSVFKGDISRWNVANVKEMACMFYASEFNGDISTWNTSRVENMNWMFSNSKFNGDLSTWDFYHDVDINNFFDFEQMDQFEIPNLYHWYLLLNGSVTQNPQWREHIDAHATIVRSLTNTENEAAMLIHKAWLSQELECEATLAVPFESLEMP